MARREAREKCIAFAAANASRTLLSGHNRPRRPRGVSLLLRDSGDGIVETDQRALVTTAVGGVRFVYHAGAFFQNNASLLPALVEHVVKEAYTGVTR